MLRRNLLIYGARRDRRAVRRHQADRPRSSPGSGSSELMRRQLLPPSSCSSCSPCSPASRTRSSSPASRRSRSRARRTARSSSATAQVVGSRLIGQPFAGRRRRPFRPERRPSAAGDGYDAMRELRPPTSGRRTPTSSTAVRRARGGVPRRRTGSAGADVPVDAVTASGSGSTRTSRSRTRACRRPASPRARGLPLADVLALVASTPTAAALGFLGEPGVNVLELNLALDATGS